MKIEMKIGNLMDVTAGHIVHGCNAQGVMGSGVALAVKNKYPDAYRVYREEYEAQGKLFLGDAIPWSPTNELVIWNAITQEFFGMPGRNCSYDAIQKSFELIDKCIKAAGATDELQEVHIPMIGAGLGGGNWEIIREIVEQTVTFPTTLWILPS